MSFQFKPDSTASLDEKLRIRKNLQDITNRIHAAKNIPQILVDLKEGILNLFNAQSVTIYVIDKIHNEIYSMFLAGTQLKEIRLPISNQSIAGYAANTYNIVNISDAYNQKELKALDFELTFDDSWDKKSGYRTKQILAAPIFYEDQIMGVIQILNRKFGDDLGKVGDFMKKRRDFRKKREPIGANTLVFVHHHDVVEKCVNRWAQGGQMVERRGEVLFRNAFLHALANGLKS